MEPTAPTSTTNPKRLISSLCLIGEYGLLFIAALTILGIVCFQSTKRLRTRLVYFYIITIMISMLRLLGWSLEPWWNYSRSKIESFLHATLFTLPAMFLVSTYTILISYWADEYVSLKTNQRTRSSIRKKILIGINVVLYFAAAIILSLNFWKPEIYRDVQAAFLNVLYILSVSTFILYGFGLYRNWKNTPIARKSSSNIRRMRLTLIITIIVSISFSLRVLANSLWTKYILQWSFRYPFEAIFYSVVEIIPIALLLCLMLASGFRFNPQSQKHQFKPLIAQFSEAETWIKETGDDSEDPVIATEDDQEHFNENGGLFD